MLNKNKRTNAKISILMIIAVIGSLAIQAITMSIIMNTYVSINWISQNTNLTIDVSKASVEIQWWATWVALWLIILHLAMLWYIGEKIDSRLRKRWPDKENISVSPTKRRFYKVRSL